MTLRSSIRVVAAAAGLLSLVGCAGPRASVADPSASARASAGWPERVLPLGPGKQPAQVAAARPAPAPQMQAQEHLRENFLPLAPGRQNRVTAARQPASQAPAQPAMRQAPTMAVSRDLERSVARFIAEPARLFDPPTPIRPWQFVVLHHSGEESGGLASIDRFHREVKGWDECGYHFIIGNGTESGDGEIEVGSRWLKQKHGAHTKDPNHPEYNDDGIGVCLIGNFDQTQPTPKQIEACRRLVAYLSARCDVPATQIVLHGDLTQTKCPGRHFPYDSIVPGRSFAAR